MARRETTHEGVRRLYGNAWNERVMERIRKGGLEAGCMHFGMDHKGDKDKHSAKRRLNFHVLQIIQDFIPTGDERDGALIVDVGCGFGTTVSLVAENFQ